LCGNILGGVACDGEGGRDVCIGEEEHSDVVH